jgi:hypothetical protein
MKQFSVITGAIVLVLVSAGTSIGQSLGDLARQEEARRRSIAQAAKVYTNEDLRVEPGPPAGISAPPVGMPADRTAPTQLPGSPVTQSSGNLSSYLATQLPSNLAAQPPSYPVTQNEAYWRQRIDAARANLTRAIILEKALQSYVNGLSNDFAARDDPAQRSVIASDRQNALLELERMQRDIRDHQKTIADIEEQARRAGVPSGWVR